MLFILPITEQRQSKVKILSLLFLQTVPQFPFAFSSFSPCLNVLFLPVICSYVKMVSKRLHPLHESSLIKALRNAELLSVALIYPVQKKALRLRVDLWLTKRFTYLFSGNLHVIPVRG